MSLKEKKTKQRMESCRGSSSWLSSRKVFVTCNQASLVKTSLVEDNVATFLKEKVLPVVGDHCRINVHWNGVDLSSLHIRSVVPDHCELVPKKAKCLSESNSPSIMKSTEVVEPIKSVPPSLDLDLIKEEQIDIKDEPIFDEVLMKDEIDLVQDLRNIDDLKTDRIICANPKQPLADRIVSVGPKLPSLRPKPPSTQPLVGVPIISTLTNASFISPVVSGRVVHLSYCRPVFIGEAKMLKSGQLQGNRVNNVDQFEKTKRQKLKVKRPKVSRGRVIPQNLK